MKVMLLCCMVLVVATGGKVEAEGVPFEQALTAYQSGDYEAAYANWLPLAEAGDARAQHGIGQLYLHGEGVTQDPAVAARWFEQAVANGLAQAQTSLGKLYAYGDGVERNYFTAFELFYRAASGGDAEAQHNLGLMYLEGRGVSRDYLRAMKWFRRSAAQGHQDAQLFVEALQQPGLGLRRLPYGKTTVWSKYG